MSIGAHAWLCNRAARWILSAKHPHNHALALVEPSSGQVYELPDVLAWDLKGRSTLIEVKTSRSDFYADRRKPHRSEDTEDCQIGMGDRRWYFAPAGILTAEDMPPKWGLAELSATGKTVKIIKEPEDRGPNRVRHQHETYMLMMCARRGHGYAKVMRLNPKSMDAVVERMVAKAIPKHLRATLDHQSKGAE